MTNQIITSTKIKNRFIILGLNIAYYRKLKGLTQEELADIVGISRVHISKIEAPNMEFFPSLRTLFDIADALDVEPGKLLEEK